MAQLIMVLWKEISSVTKEEQCAIRREVPDAEFKSFYPKTPREHALNCKAHRPVAVLLPEEGFLGLALYEARHVVMGNGRKSRRHLFRVKKERPEVEGLGRAIAPTPKLFQQSI